MSWSEFYIIVSGLITLVLLIVAFPWLRNKNHAKQDSLSNTQIVKQRLAELDRETRVKFILVLQHISAMGRFRSIQIRSVHIWKQLLRGGPNGNVDTIKTNVLKAFVKSISQYVRCHPQ